MDNFTDYTNVNPSDRAFRGIVATVALVLAISGSVTPALIAALSIVGIYLVTTIITGWDPLYALIERQTGARLYHAEHRHHNLGGRHGWSH